MSVALLCGRDPHTQKDYSHRRDWIVRREEQLAGLFALELEFRTEMSNHLHNVLRTLPQVARRWSAREVARRWLTITKLAKCRSDDLPQPDPQRVEKLAQDQKKIQKLRRRLSSVSWYMGILCENIARRANAEDECTGRFWEARFKCRECTDESAILLCGIYVDLNPLRTAKRTARKPPVTRRSFSGCKPTDCAKRPGSARRLAGGTHLAARAEGGRRIGLCFADRTPRVGPGTPADLTGGLREAAQVDGPTAAKWPAEHDSAGPRRGAGSSGCEARGLAGHRGAVRTLVWPRRGPTSGTG